MNISKQKTLLTVEDAANLLNVKISWVRSAVFKKEIPYIKIGNLVRFKEEELLEWIDKKMIDCKQ